MSGPIPADRLTGPAPASGRLARNTALNVVGQLLPLAAALPLLPYILGTLGNERFAVLTLAWTVIGYFGFLDLGLGRAATQHVAGCLGAGRTEEIPRVIWSSLALQALLGAAGALVIALLAPLLAEDVLNIADPILLIETRRTLLVVGLGLPLVLLSGTFSGVLEAHQRFDLVNTVRVPANVATLAIPAAGAAAGVDLPLIVIGIVAARALGLLAFALLAARVSGGLGPVLPQWPILRQLLRFGGWLTLSLLAVPLLTYSERLLIGGLRSLTELAYYAVPFEIVARTAILPSAVALTLFPAFSFAQSSGGAVADLFRRPLRMLFLLQWPLLVVFWLLPHEIIDVWMNREMADAGAGALRVLAVAFFVNGFAQVALAGVQGLGRPDLKARLDVVQVPLYIAAAAFLIARFGVLGAAWAKLIFTLLDAVVLFTFARRLGAPPLIGARWVREHSAGLAGSIMFAAVAAATVLAPFPVRAMAAAAAIVVIGVAFWRRALAPEDRAAVRRLLTRAPLREATP